MAYDLLIKNGRIVDGSGMPAFRGDVGVKDGKIVEIGKLSGPAKRTIDAAGQVVAPGFIDNHCHYDAQVTWDPLCSFSPDHGATTVVFGNCSLSLAPVRRGTEKRVAEFLSYVEAIPMEVLNTVEVDWETIPQYMDRLDQHLGVNVGNLIGHTTVRYYVMGDECQKRAATDDEIKTMQDVVRDGMKGGALGLSVSRNKGHYDPQGVHIPALWADEKEIFALGDVLREMGTGIIQSRRRPGRRAEGRLMARLSEATGRTVVYNNLGQTVREPDEWKKHMARVEETSKAGIRAYPLCSPNRDDAELHDEQLPGVPRLADLAPDPAVLGRGEAAGLCRPGDPAETARGSRRAHGRGPGRRLLARLVELHVGRDPGARKEQVAEGQDDRPDRQGAEQAGHRRLPRSRRRGEARNRLHAGREQCRRRGDDEDPDLSERIIGLSDGGAHVQFHGGYGYSTRLLGEWVREKQVMTLEQAVRRLTFDSASTFGLYDRGLLRPGMAADIVIFDPDTVRPLPESVVHDFPAGGWRIKEPAAGIIATIVNGQVLMENGKHTGACPAACCATPTTTPPRLASPRRLTRPPATLVAGGRRFRTQHHISCHGFRALRRAAGVPGDRAAVRAVTNGCRTPPGWDEREEFPVEALRQAAALGFAGIYVGDEFGGSGLGRLDATIIFEELGDRLRLDRRLSVDPQHGGVDDRPLRHARRSARGFCRS